MKTTTWKHGDDKKNKKANISTNLVIEEAAYCKNKYSLETLANDKQVLKDNYCFVYS